MNNSYYRRRKRNRRKQRVRVIIGVCGLLVLVLLVLSMCKAKEPQSTDEVPEPTQEVITSTYTTTPTNTPTQAPTMEPYPTTEAYYEAYGDPNNYIYPYNTMSADWGVELYESGFKYYEIPDKYKEAGGCFPEVVQAYLWCLCEERGIDYYMVVALIERESWYKYDATGDSGNSFGYMQIYKKWHIERMETEGVTDLFNPYGNIRVGLSFIQEIQDKYLSSSGAHCVLMVYNMGESRAKQFWREGTYSTTYTREILQRAEEIKQELQD